MFAFIPDYSNYLRKEACLFSFLHLASFFLSIPAEINQLEFLTDYFLYTKNIFYLQQKNKKSQALVSGAQQQDKGHELDNRVLYEHEEVVLYCEDDKTLK